MNVSNEFEKTEMPITPHGAIFLARVEAGSTIEHTANGRYLLVNPPGKDPYLIDTMGRFGRSAIPTVTIADDAMPIER